MLRTLLLITGSLYFLQSASQTYSEEDVRPYTLPHVLETSTGKKITAAKAWEEVRRREIISLFEDNVYGKMPRHFESIEYSNIREERAAMNGRAHLKEVQIKVSGKQHQAVIINLVLFIPNNIKYPAPVFLLINHRDKINTDPARITKSEFWPAEMMIDSSYAIAAFHVSDVAADNAETFKDGVLAKLYPEQLGLPNGMRAIGSWAWAASRVMDYFVNSKDIDAGKVCIVGHSRGGKAALWAAATDTRFAIAFSNCSGNTGAALSRRRFGETVKKINDAFPYWFNDNYKRFNDRENELPVDQHMLIALMAPRPVYVTNASKDLWADPTGTYLALKNAEPAYSVYYKNAALPAQPPAINQPLIQGTMGYHNREGIHDLTRYDWINFIRFANQMFYVKRVDRSK